MDISTLLKLSLYCVIIVNADVCVKKSPCSCLFPNGTGIDLTPSATNSVFTSEIHVEEKMSGNMLAMSTFYFHPCYDVRIPKPKPLEVDSCSGMLSICRMHKILRKVSRSGWPTWNQYSEEYHFIGTVQQTEFSPDGSYIEYLNLPSKTFVYLVCAETDDKLRVRDTSAPNSLKLDFFSRNACSRQLSPVSNTEDIPEWMGSQWSKVSEAIKGGYTDLLNGLKWLFPQPLERNPSLRY